MGWEGLRSGGASQLGALYEARDCAAPAGAKGRLVVSMDVEKQVLLIWAATNGFADDVPVDQVGKFETELLRFVENSRPGLLQSLREKKAVTDEIKNDLEQTLKDFKDVWAEKTEAVAA